jgi:hypothetical protein
MKIARDNNRNAVSHFSAESVLELLSVYLGPLGEVALTKLNRTWNVLAQFSVRLPDKLTLFRNLCITNSTGL